MYWSTFCPRNTVFELLKAFWTKDFLKVRKLQQILIYRDKKVYVRA